MTQITASFLLIILFLLFPLQNSHCQQSRGLAPLVSEMISDLESRMPTNLHSQFPTLVALKSIRSNPTTLATPISSQTPPEVQALLSALKFRFRVGVDAPKTISFLGAVPVIWAIRSTDPSEVRQIATRASIDVATNWFMTLSSYGIEKAIDSRSGYRILSIAEKLYSDLSHPDRVKLTQPTDYRIALDFGLDLLRITQIHVSHLQTNNTANATNAEAFPAVTNFSPGVWIGGQKNAFSIWFQTIAESNNLATRELQSLAISLSSALKNDADLLGSLRGGHLTAEQMASMLQARYAYDHMAQSPPKLWKGASSAYNNPITIERPKETNITLLIPDFYKASLMSTSIKDKTLTQIASLGRRAELIEGVFSFLIKAEEPDQVNDKLPACYKLLQDINKMLITDFSL